MFSKTSRSTYRQSSNKKGWSIEADLQAVFHRGYRFASSTAYRKILPVLPQTTTPRFKYDQGNAAFFINEDCLLIEDWF